MLLGSVTWRPLGFLPKHIRNRSGTARLQRQRPQTKLGSPSVEGVPSPLLSRILKKENIAFPVGFKSVAPRPNTTKLSIGISKQHVFHPWHARHLVANPNGLPHPYYQPTLQRYKDKRAEPLWWFVLTHTDSDLKSSPLAKSKMRRRLQSAFRQALKRKGYDEAGRRVEGLDGGASGPRELYGSVKIEGTVRTIVSTDVEVLLDFLERAIEGVERHLGRDSVNESAVVEPAEGALEGPNAR